MPSAGEPADPAALPARCARIRLITAGSSMLAITCTRPPQCSQVSISNRNTRFNRCDQRIARCRSAGVLREAGALGQQRLARRCRQQRRHQRLQREGFPALLRTDRDAIGDRVTEQFFKGRVRPWCGLEPGARKRLMLTVASSLSGNRALKRRSGSSPLSRAQARNTSCSTRN